MCVDTPHPLHSLFLKNNIQFISSDTTGIKTWVHRNIKVRIQVNTGKISKWEQHS